MGKFIYGRESSHWFQMVTGTQYLFDKDGDYYLLVRSKRRDDSPSYEPDIAYQVKRLDEFLKDRKIRYVMHDAQGKAMYGRLYFQCPEDALTLKLKLTKKGFFGYDEVKGSAN